MHVLIVPTRWETEVVLGALPGAVPEPGWDVPAWRTGDLLMVEPGMGPGLAAALLPRLEMLELQAVWLYGWCGGLTPDLDVGDLVLADATIFAGEDGPTTRVSHPAPDLLLAEMRGLAQELGRRMVVGSALTSDHVLSSVEQKRAAAASGAVAVEMEAGPLAQWATGRSLPFVHLRVVLDHPGEWPSPWRLFRQIRTARRVMTVVIRALVRPGGPLGPKTHY
jgi:nucleoside phosphorylase